MILPGFIMPAGSKAALTRRIRSMATGGAVAISSSRFSWPMPCSAEIEPLRLAHHVVHRLVHRPVEREEGFAVAADGLRDIVVQIAVAHVAEADDARVRRNGRDRLAGTRDEFGDRSDRHGNVVLDRGAFHRLRVRKRFALLPEGGCLREVRGDRASPTMPASRLAARMSSASALRILRRTARGNLHQHVPRPSAGERRARCPAHAFRRNPAAWRRSARSR